MDQAFFLIIVPSLRSSSDESETLRVPSGNVTLPFATDEADDVDTLSSNELVTLLTTSVATDATLSKFSLVATLDAVSVATFNTSSVLMELTLLTKL